jgi:MFS transporter, BCD family, chlorophyll transporter
MFDYRTYALNRIAAASLRYMPFAEAASREVPLSRLMRLALFQVTVGMVLVLLAGTLNRVMIVELGVPATLVSVMLALPLVFAPFRALIGHRSDNLVTALGWRRVPYIYKGTLLQFGGFAIMPFALLVLAGFNEAHDAPRWIGLTAAALAFLLVGAGAHIVQTVGLALATDLVPERDQPAVVGLMYTMLLVGMGASALIYGALLSNFSPLRLIQVIQGTAVVSVLLNFVAIWKQEARDRERARTPRLPESFGVAWAALAAQPGMLLLLGVIALGTAGFGMADVLLEPFGGQVLGMSVSGTTRLTVVLACGTLAGFALASRLLLRGGVPLRIAFGGATVGIPGFAVIILAGMTVSVPALVAGTALAGFGAGLFGHGTLTATMRAAPRDRIGLSLGAWGAVQTTAAGIGIAVAGVLRDRIVAGGTDGSAAAPYLPVFVIEIALLALAALAALRFLKSGVATQAERAMPVSRNAAVPQDEPTALAGPHS